MSLTLVGDHIAKRRMVAVTVVCAECLQEYTRWALTGKDDKPLRNAAAELCEACMDAAYQSEQRLAEEGTEQYGEQRRAARITRARLPKAFRSARSDFIHEDLLPRIAAWGNGDLRGLLLYGGVGVGKSCAAAVACMARLDRSDVSWVSVAALMTRLKLGFGDAEKERAHALVADGTDIVLDDLDKINPTEFGRDIIYTLVDARVTEEASLLVTTNLPPAQLSRRLGDPVVSRLVGYCEVVEVGGHDRRLDR